MEDAHGARWKVFLFTWLFIGKISYFNTRTNVYLNEPPKALRTPTRTSFPEAVGINPQILVGSSGDGCPVGADRTLRKI
jgi:hypothetical protein